MKEVRLQNISKIFDKHEALRNLSFTVKKGDMISLLGPSGSGKTTTLKIIAGLLEADQGSVFIDGKSIDHLPTQKRGAVMVFQDHRLFPHMTVGANIEFGLRMKGVPKDIRRKKVQEMLGFVGLEAQGGKLPGQISGGEKQRVAIARGLIVDPQVLLLDEPFSNLDQRLKEEMRRFVVEIQQKLKITTILVTHDKEDALLTSSKIGVMFNGKLQQYGTPEELYETPNSLKVARFFGEINEIPIESIDQESVYTPLGTYKKAGKLQAIDKTDKLLLRPEAVKLSNSKGKGKSPGNTGLSAKITNRTFAGDKTYYELEGEALQIRASVIGKGAWQTGDGVMVHALKEALILCSY